jgi:hypothetical protein
MLSTRVRPASVVADPGTTSPAAHVAGVTTRSAARIGAIAGVLGDLVLFVSTLLHPLGADPSDAPAAFAEYAADSLWVWSHLGQFLGFALLAVTLAALASTFEPGRAAWARIGLVGTAAIVAVAAALQAVDGVALKVMVDRWAAAGPDARPVAFEAAFAVRQIEVGFASLLSLISGLTVTVFAVGILGSRRYSRWLGLVGVCGGLGTLAAGLAQATTGFSGPSMTLSMLSSAVLLDWVVLVAISMWRLARSVSTASDDPSSPA